VTAATKQQAEAKQYEIIQAEGAELVVDGGGTCLPMVVQQDPGDFLV
jgi:hypothetical protein